MGRKLRYQVEYFEGEEKKVEIVFALDAFEAENEFNRHHAGEASIKLFHVERFNRLAA